MLKTITRFVQECETCKKTHDVFFFGDTGSCSECSDKSRVVQSKRAFYDRIIEIGGQVLGSYQGSKTSVKYRCKQGHICNSSPSDIQQGRRICKTCAENEPGAAEVSFRIVISELGGEMLGSYQGSKVPVKCRCKQGHECSPRPSDIQQGKGMCATCAGNDPIAAEVSFREAILELKGEVIGPYKGSGVSVKCVCKEGHICNPCPSNIKKGQGMCKTCTGNDAVTAEANFRESIAKLGGKVTGSYRGVGFPTECICKQGHICNPYPSSIKQGRGMCKTCAERDPAVAEANFRESIAKMGGEVIGAYIGTSFPTECRCKEGHVCNPRPSDIQQGKGMCSSCGLKSEPICRDIFEEILEISMTKQRPIWLCWKNGRALELDGYNEEKKIAFEYQGAQHDKYIPHFHRDGIQDFEIQQQKDIFKAQACIDRGIKLICIPCIYTYRNPDAMRKFIIAALQDQTTD